MASLLSTFYKEGLLRINNLYSFSILFDTSEGTWMSMASKERQINFFYCTHKCLLSFCELRASLFFQGHINWKFASFSFFFCPYSVKSGQIFCRKQNSDQWTMTRHTSVNICDVPGPMLGALQTLSFLIITATLYGKMMCLLWVVFKITLHFKENPKSIACHPGCSLLCFIYCFINF